MESTLLISLLLLLLLLWLFIRRRSDQAAARPARRPAANQKKTAYHAVSLRFPRNACAAAKALQGERFLASEAPKLPLPNCNASHCECHFAHHDDRRSGKDRRNVFKAAGYSASTGRFEQERRRGSDRRKDDEEGIF